MEDVPCRVKKSSARASTKTSPSSGNAIRVHTGIAKCRINSLNVRTATAYWNASNRGNGELADRSVTYFWDVLAWRASRSVQRMTWAAKGMYREMLDEQRDKGSLPDCPRACADLMGGPVEQWIECWPMLRRCFVDRRAKVRQGDEPLHDPNDHDPQRRIVNLKMAKTMREQRAYFRHKRESGRKGGLVSAEKRKASSLSSAVAPAQAPSSEKNREEGKREEKKREEGKGIAFSGRVLTVFTWQVEELGKRLIEQRRGDFDLIGWFERVEADIERRGVVLPMIQADRWRWLLDRLYTDAQLRRPSLTKSTVPPDPAVYAGWMNECLTLHQNTCKDFKAHHARMQREVPA